MNIINEEVLEVLTLFRKTKKSDVLDYKSLNYKIERQAGVEKLLFSTRCI